MNLYLEIKEVQEEYIKAYENCKWKAHKLDKLLARNYSFHFEFVYSSFFFDESPQGYDYWHRVVNEDYSDLTYPATPINNPIKGGIAQFLTTTDLVSFGNYLLSDARKELIMSNPETSPEAKTEILKQVTDADIANWENLKL